MLRYDLPVRTCREDQECANERLHLSGIGRSRLDNSSLLFRNASGPSAPQTIARGGYRDLRGRQMGIWVTLTTLAVAGLALACIMFRAHWLGAFSDRIAPKR